MGISSMGVGSGLDLAGLVDQLLAAERGPTEQRLARKEQVFQAQLSALSAVKGAVSNIKNSVAKLGTLEEGRSASTSDSKVLSVKAEETAATGSYEIKVNSLAQAQSLVSGNFTDASTIVGSGTLTIRFGTTDYDGATDTYNGFTADAGRGSVDISIRAGSTLADIRDQINSADKGVTASILTDENGARLMLSPTETGAASSLEITSSGGALAAFDFNSANPAMVQEQAARDASLTINGATLTSGSNTVENAIDGVTLTLKELTETGKSVKVNVSRDTAVITNALKAFVDAYNGLHKVVSNVASYDAETKQAGILLGDATLRSVTALLRNRVIDPIDGLSDEFDSLAELGVSTQADGSLTLDSDRLKEAIDSDYDGLLEALKGVGGELRTALGGYVDADGAFDAKTDGIKSQLDNIADSRAALNRRIASLEVMYSRQFSALDSLVSQLQSTGNFLTQQLASLPKINNRRD